ncbi:hypothetical protein [Mesorhizobium sp. M1393]|uniref:AbiTii domain-containing protein n=1 Tax=unclassified Mesorhizobium TaxID=325217 RepID=UPI00333CF610
MISRSEKGETYGIDCRNLILLFQGKVYDGMSCISINSSIDIGAFVRVQQTVRSKVLDLTLELEKSVPAAAEIMVGQSAEAIAPEDKAQVTHRLPGVGRPQSAPGNLIRAIVRIFSILEWSIIWVHQARKLLGLRPWQNRAIGPGAGLRSAIGFCPGAAASRTGSRAGVGLTDTRSTSSSNWFARAGAAVIVDNGMRRPPRRSSLQAFG